jgi:uncharacterized protein (DUF983 family)
MGRRLWRAVRLQCPRCGAGGVFRRWVSMAERCHACELRFEREEGYWLGAVAINTLVTIGVFVATLVTWAVLAWPDPPWTAITVAGVAVTVLTPIAFHPLSRSLWMFLEGSVRPEDETRRAG